ncbi:unnamed protein product [Polarella glacialis]|uniref:COP9 signalosome complex subunit 4 n=1 Tax=Polarella glacialis TaxID=89957 RepID=A0A813G4U1_POLGL|nr:unnamed protein product [Polarella glacialis]
MSGAMFQLLSGIVSSTSDASGRMEKFSVLVKSLVGEHDVQQLKDLVDCMLAEESTFALFSRPVLQQVAEQMNQLKNPELKELGRHTLERLKGRVVSFEEEDFVIRELLSDVFQAEGDWNEAAKCLAAINLETGTRCRTSLQKAEKYVKIAELYLEDDDAVAADTFCNRAAMVMHEVEEMPLQLRYKVCHARILDSKRKFLDAASKYCDLSQQTFGGQICEEDLVQLLKCAVTCALLAPAGPQRSRILALLCKDERIRVVEHYEILHKMFMERLIRGVEVQKFAESLLPHQKAIMPDGQTVLERAVLQHNVLAASRVYKNMRLPDLGNLLEASPWSRADRAGFLVFLLGGMADPEADVPLVEGAFGAALLAQAGRPFVVRHKLEAILPWAADIGRGAAPREDCELVDAASSVLRDCALASVPYFNVLAPAPAQDRKRWGVGVEATDSRLEADDDIAKSGLQSLSADVSSRVQDGPRLQWVPLLGQPASEASASGRPRHICTADEHLEQALLHWEGRSLEALRVEEVGEGSSSLNTPVLEALGEAAARFVYLRGTVSQEAGEEALQGTVFEELKATAAFGSDPFRMSLYASRAGMQTNLHCDEHSGFLVQLVGVKRVILIGRKEARPLRCPAWGQRGAPVSRRSWFDDGVSAGGDWASKPPLAGVAACQEVEVGPGEALFIPKGVFHDVLSKDQVSQDKAEKIAAKMIAEKRLEGFIDQRSGIIHFEGSGENLQQWDRHITNVCSQVNSVLSKVKEQSAMKAHWGLYNSELSLQTRALMINSVSREDRRISTGHAGIAVVRQTKQRAFCFQRQIAGSVQASMASMAASVHQLRVRNQRTPRGASSNKSRLGFAALGLASAAVWVGLRGHLTGPPAPLALAESATSELAFVLPLASGQYGILQCPSVRSSSQVARLAGYDAVPGGKPVADEDEVPMEQKKVRLRPGEETESMQFDRVAKKIRWLKQLKGKFVPVGAKPWNKHAFTKVCMQVRLMPKQAANTKIINQVTEELRRITGMHPRVVKAKHNVAKLGWRIGDNCGVAVSLFGPKMYDFLERMNTIILPRVRDFEGIYPNSIDNFGNFWMSLDSQEPFKELDELIDQRELVHSFDIGILNNCMTQPDGLALMQGYGFPFGETRPRKVKTKVKSFEKKKVEVKKRVR